MSDWGPCRDCGNPAEGSGSILVGEWAYCPPCADWRQDRDYLFDLRARAVLQHAWLDIVAQFDRATHRQRKTIVRASARPVGLPFEGA